MMRGLIIELLLQIAVELIKSCWPFVMQAAIWLATFPVSPGALPMTPWGM